MRRTSVNATIGVLVAVTLGLTGCSGGLQSRVVRIDAGGKTYNAQVTGTKGQITSDLKLHINNNVVAEGTMSHFSPLNLSGKFDGYVFGAECYKTPVAQGWMSDEGCAFVFNGKTVENVKLTSSGVGQ